MIEVPRDTQPSTCRGRDCGVEVYWVDRPRVGHPGKQRVPVDCNEKGGFAPDSLSAGRGVDHRDVCVNARDF